jgi:hypothetical protein
MSARQHRAILLEDDRLGLKSPIRAHDATLKVKVMKCKEREDTDVSGVN